MGKYILKLSKTTGVYEVVPPAQDKKLITGTRILWCFLISALIGILAAVAIDTKQKLDKTYDRMWVIGCLDGGLSHPQCLVELAKRKGLKNDRTN